MKAALRTAENLSNLPTPPSSSDDRGPSSKPSSSNNNNNNDDDAKKLDAPNNTTDNKGDLPAPTKPQEVSVKVKLVSPPLYVLTSTCLEKAVGISTLESAIGLITMSITAAGGSCNVKMAPKAVTESDDAELAALMEKRERENMEVSGDESGSESDEGVGE